MTTVAAFWNTTDGDWFTAANWNETDQNGTLVHDVPNAGNDVSISGSSAFTITYDGTDTINTIGGASLVTIAMNGGSLTITNGGAASTVSSVNAIDLAASATLSVDAGTLLLGNGSLTGTLSGAGDLDLYGGSFNLNAGVVLSVATLDLGVTGNGTVSTTNLNVNLGYAGTFRLDETGGNNAVLNLQGHTLTLSGTDDFEGTVNGPGSVVVTGVATESSAGFARADVVGGAVLEGAAGSTITQDSGGLGLGDGGSTGTLQVDAGSNYDIVATSSLGSTTPANAVVDNSGTIDVSGNATATISAALTNTGTLNIESGSAAVLSPAASDTLGGIVTGAGALQFGPGAVRIATADIDVAAFSVDGGNGGATTTLANDLSYAGAFTADGEFDTFDLDGHTLTLGGPSTLASAFDGPGIVKVTGAATVGGSADFEGGVLLEDAGSITQTGNVGLSATATATATLQIDLGATYTIGVAGNIAGDFSNTGTTVNNGTLIDDAAGTSQIDGAFTNSGTLSVAAGSTLQFDGSPSDVLGGTISGAGDLVFGPGAVSIATATLDVAAITIDGGNPGAQTSLGTSLTFSGNFAAVGEFDTFTLDGNTLTLSGAATLASAFNGPGTVKVTGTAMLGGSDAFQAGALLEDDGSISQTGDLRLVATSTATASLQIDAGATYTIGTASRITGDFSDAGTLANSGTLVDSAAGTSEIDAAVTNLGTIESAGGASLDIAAPVTGTGQMQVDGNAVLDLNGAVDTGQTVHFNGAGAELGLGAPASFAGSITGFAAGDTIDLAGESVTGLTYADGTATVTLSNGTTQAFQVSGSFGSLTTGSDGSDGTDILASNAAALQLAINPTVTFKTPTTAVLSGSVDGGTGAIAVEFFEGNQDLGAATVNADGTFTFIHTFGKGFQTGLAAVATDANGDEVTMPTDFDLTTGIAGNGEKSTIDNYNAAGLYLGTTEFNAKGQVFLQSTYTALANGDQKYSYIAGSDLTSLGLRSYVDTFEPNSDLLSEVQNVLDGGRHTLIGAGAHDTFVFERGFGQDTVTDFNDVGSGHDVLSLPKSEFSSLAQVIEQAKQYGDTTVLTARDGDRITLDYVAIHELKAQDFKFHT